MKSYTLYQILTIKVRQSVAFYNEKLHFVSTIDHQSISKCSFLQGKATLYISDSIIPSCPPSSLPSFLRSSRFLFNCYFSFLVYDLLGFRVQGLVFRVWGLWFRVYGLGFRVQDLGFIEWSQVYRSVALCKEKLHFVSKIDNQSMSKCSFIE